MPVDAGLCQWDRLYARRPDGQPVLDLADIVDLNEILLVRSENERRALDAAERKRRNRQR